MSARLSLTLLCAQALGLGQALALLPHQQDPRDLFGVLQGHGPHNK